MSNNQIEIENNISIIDEQEDQDGFFIDGIFDGLTEKIRKIDFSLKESHNFRNDIFKQLRNKFSRKNIIQFGIMTGEEAVPTEYTSGNVILPIIDTNQIKKRINSLKKEVAKKISYIHVSTVQIMIKSTFLEGIDSPLKIELRDDRIINQKDSIIAKGNGNLSKGKIKFDVNLQIGISLKDADLNQSIILYYELLRKDLFKKGNHPFTISYKINYALTNSHYSIDFKASERIYIDELFSSVFELQSSRLERTSSFISKPRLSLKIEKPLGLKESDEISNIQKSIERLEKKF